MFRFTFIYILLPAIISAQLSFFISDKSGAGKHNIYNSHKTVKRLNSKINFKTEPTLFNYSLNLTKSIFLDYPVIHYLMVLNHEYYGHYAAFKEISTVTPVNFHVDLPPPYGKGSGYASYLYSRLSYDEALWINFSGVNTNLDLSNTIIKENFVNGNLDKYDFLLQQASFNDLIFYVLLSKDNGTGDINYYINDLRYKYKQSLSLKDLKNSVHYSLLNPILWSYLYQQIFVQNMMINYAMSIPKIRFKHFNYFSFPMLELTPFGPQYRLDHYIESKNNLHILTTSFGDNSIEKFWQITYEKNKILNNKDSSTHITISPKVSIWNQPRLTINNKKYKHEIGFSVGLNSTFPISFIQNRFIKKVSIITETGYKTAGFYLTEHLAEDVFIRLGIRII